MKSVALWFLLATGFIIYGQQDVEFIKKNFKDNVRGYKDAMDSIEAGDEFYNQGTLMSYRGLHFYLSAEKFNPNNSILNYKIGRCMLSHNSPEKTDALTYLQRAFKLNPSVAPDIYYWLGYAYHLRMEWDTARQNYSAYSQTLDPVKDVGRVNDVKKKIEECQNGKEFIQHPVRCFIDNLGPNINTLYPEFGALITADETEVIFTSSRPNTTGGKLDPINGVYFEDLYISYFKNGAWTPAINMGAPINTADHDATAGISPDGQTLYVYRDKNNGDIYESHLKGNTWSKPESIGDKINSDYHESTCSLGPDGKTLYFVSDRPGGFGDRDIYKTVKDAKGRWSDPENLGPNINTAYGEEGVSIQADGRTLYFSSQGHNSMGGYDVFKSVYENGHWSLPENLGYPINTADDDVFFVVSASGKHGYFSSIRKGGYGEKDIYMVTFLGPEKPMALSNEDNLLAGTSSEVADLMVNATVKAPAVKTTLLKGIITDSLTHLPMEASIELTDNEKNKIIASFSSNSSTGKYLVSLPSGINYGIAVKADNYLFYSENFNLPDSSTYRVVEKNIALQPINIGSRIVLRNVFFDFDKATLRPESQSELERLINILNTYSSLKIEISGYTDNIGAADYNKKLSEARAKSVVDYLIAHGISSTRMTYKGYGKDNPIATNDTEEGRQLNRRTEFKITGK